jgi:hypothetical protein
MTFKRILTLTSLLFAALVISIQTLSAQVVEPDEHDFMIATPDQLQPEDGSITTATRVNPASTLSRLPGLRDAAADLTITTRHVTLTF